MPHLGPTDRQLGRFGRAQTIEVKTLYQIIRARRVERMAMTRSHSNNNNNNNKNRQVQRPSRMYRLPPHSLYHSNKFRISEMALVVTPVSSSKVLD